MSTDQDTAESSKLFDVGMKMILSRHMLYLYFQFSLWWWIVTPHVRPSSSWNGYVIICMHAVYGLTYCLTSITIQVRVGIVRELYRVIATVSFLSGYMEKVFLCKMNSACDHSTL